MKAQEMRDARVKLHEQYTAILTEAKDQEGGLTTDQRTNLDKLDARMVEMKADIDRLEAHEQREAELKASRGRVTDSEVVTHDPTAEERAARRDKAMRAWFQVGAPGTDMSDEDSKLAREFSPSGTVTLKMADTRTARRIRQEFRAQSVGTTTAGGFTVPEGFVAELERAMLQFGGMRQANTRIIRTATGQVLPWPKYNDTGNTGALLAENTQDSEQDVAFTELQLDAYKYTSKIVRVSKELMQDSAFDMASELGQILGERLGRIHNTHQTTGTGSSQPNGVATAATSGVTAASATVLTWLELIALEHSVDPAYRNGAQYMFNDTTLSEIRQLVDGDGRPLWQPGLTVGAPDSINGYSYVINQDVADTATTA